MNSYLLKRNDRFYFRIRIPESLQPYFGRKEIKTSLRTSDKKTAYRLAHALFVQVNDTLERMKGRDPKLKNILAEFAKSGELTKLDVDTGDPERDFRYAKELLDQIGSKPNKALGKPPNLGDIFESHA